MDDDQPVGEHPPLSPEQHAEMQANLFYPDVVESPMLIDLDASYDDDLAAFDVQRQEMAQQAVDVAVMMAEGGVPEEKRPM